MPKKQNYIPRLFATGLSFAIFFLVGILLTLVLAPISLLLPLGAKRRRRWGLILLRKCFAAFIWFVGLLRLVRKLEVIGTEHVHRPQPRLIIANHPSLVDVVFVLAAIPKCNCMVKKALFNTLAMGGILRAAGFIPNDAGTSFIDRARECFAEGYSLLMFPEGTRSPMRDLNKFSRGAAQVALRTGVPVVKTLVTFNPPTLKKGCKWYQITDRAVDIRIEFFAPETPPAIAAEGQIPVQVREVTRAWEDFFRFQLATHLWHLPEQQHK